MFARALARLVERGASLVDRIAEQAEDPAWSRIAGELGRLALRLLDVVDGAAPPTRPTLPLIGLPN